MTAPVLDGTSESSERAENHTQASKSLLNTHLRSYACIVYSSNFMEEITHNKLVSDGRI